jgi:hypothetical protein
MIDPTTYSEWSDCVEIFETGEQDDAVVLAMSRGTLNWNSGVAGLFSERISGAFNTRLKRCADRMERDFKSGGDETTVVRAMLDTRRTLTLLHRVATIPSFPEMLREHLSREIRKYAERAQQSLEDSAKHDRSGRLASLMRNNSLLRYEPIPELATSTTPAPKSADVAQATVPVSEPAAAPSPSDVASASTVRRNAGSRWTFIASGAIVVMCVVASATWFSMRGKDSIPVPVATVAAPVSTAAVSSPSQVAPSPREATLTAAESLPPSSVQIAVPATSAPAEADSENRVVALSTPTERAAAKEVRPVPLSKPITEQHQEHSSNASALAAIIDEGEACFNKKKFDCAISAAGSALRLNPTYARAVDLKRRAEAEQKRALDSISIN